MIINSNLSIITGKASDPVLHALEHLKRDLNESLGTFQIDSLCAMSQREPSPLTHLSLSSNDLMHVKQARLLRLLLWLSLC